MVRIPAYPTFTLLCFNVFASALSVPASPQPGAPPPARLAPKMTNSSRSSNSRSGTRQKARSMIPPSSGVVERRIGFRLLSTSSGFSRLSTRKIQRVLRHYLNYHPVAEHAGLAEDAPHRDTAERR